jgi:hypothetical protein
MTAIMKRILRFLIATLLLGSTTVIAVAGLLYPAQAHEEEFSAGEPGNPKKPARVIRMSMRDGDGKMSFAPDRITVKKKGRANTLHHSQRWRFET